MKKAKCPNCVISQIIYKFDSNKFQIYFCRKCLNGFTYPVPKNLGKYYDDDYWISKGILGILKNTIYRLSQVRRKYWVMSFLPKGDILDVGSGEGNFSKLLGTEYLVTSLDVPSAKIKNPEILKVDFLNWRTSRKFDAIVFWESLEHTQYPEQYIKKASTLLKKGGYIFIEYPRFDSFESRLFKNYWFHLDPPRHLSHLTPKGLDKILSRVKLISSSHRGVFAFEYSVGGFASSILNVFLPTQKDFFKNSKNTFFLFLLIPLILISLFIEVFLFIIGRSPIYLSIAQKNRS